MVSLGKKILVYGLCSMLASPFMIMPRQTAYATAPTAKTLYYGGTIYTMTESVKEVQNNVAPHKAYAVVVDDTTGRIEKVVTDPGAVSAYVDDASITRKFDLGTNVMFPGFIDPHSHFPVSAANISGINLNPSPIADPGVNTLEQLQQKLLDHLANNDYAGQTMGGYPLPATWVSGSGYDDTLLDIKSHPTQEDLMVGDLANYYVSIGHSSGHMTAVNTNALKRLLNIDPKAPNYLQGKLTNVLREAGTITGTQTVVDADIIKGSDGLLKYQIKLNDGSTQNLSGIQLRQDGWKGHTFDPAASKEDKLIWFTGLLQESGSDYVASTNNPAGDFPFIPKMAQFIPYAAKEYMSRGVTSGNDGGGNISFPFARDLADAQTALLNNRLPIRMVIQPRIYLNFGEGFTEATLQNHYALGWENLNGGTALGNPSADSPQTGNDITTWCGGGDANTAASSTHPGMKGENADPSTLAGQLYTKAQADPAEYKDRIMLGTWKYNYDGSIQGYTGYLAQQGYYQKPADVPIYNPGGRIGDEAAGTGQYTIGGTANGDTDYSDPKYFCFGGHHYGNEKSLGNGTYDSVAEAIKLYHLQSQGVSLHLNGSWANDDVINFVEQACYAAVQAGKDIKDTRHTVIHAQMQDLSHIQRIMGNYDKFPISNPADVQRFTNVWSGVNAMKWVKEAQVANPTSAGYDPEEGHYETEFTTAQPDLGQNLRDALGGAGVQNLVRQQNMISSYFVDHTYYWGERHRDIFMGPGRAYNMSPMGWAVKLGHRYTFHNDCPVTPQNPLKSITIATTRLSSGYQAGGVKAAQQPIYSATGGKEIGKTKMYYPTKELADEGNPANMKEFHDFDQRITVLQALHAVTVNSAFSSKIEDRFGSIKEGYHADFVILANDPFEFEKLGESGLLQIADIPVVATVVADEAVFGFVPGTAEGDFVSYLESSFYDAGNVSNITDIDQTADEMEAMMNDQEGQQLFGAKKFSANVTPNGAIGTFSVQVMGNGQPISSLNVKSLANAAGAALPYEFAEQAMNDAQGMFWVTDRNLETVLSGDTIMEPGKAYYIHFTVEDGGDYDLDGSIDGSLTGQIFVTASQLPEAPAAIYPGPYSSGSGGCTVGSSAQYELIFVFFAALGLLAVRIYRKRENA